MASGPPRRGFPLHPTNPSSLPPPQLSEELTQLLNQSRRNFLRQSILSSRTMPGRHDELYPPYDSSDDEMNGENDEVSGDEDETDKKMKKTELDDEPHQNGVTVEPGMQGALKNLYSGTEDKRGRFKWQDKIPKDVGRPAEDAKTAQYAIIARYVKVYNDPRKVLEIHSIVVQSPLLKTLLTDVLKDYPGVTVGLNRLEFERKCEPLIHRWTELKAAIAAIDESTEDGKQTKEHAVLLQELLSTEFKDLIDVYEDMAKNGVMTYEQLWTIFQPGALIYTRQDGQDMVMKLHHLRYGKDRNGNPVAWVTAKYVDWDGTQFGTKKLNLKVSYFKGTKNISTLNVYPLRYHADAEGLRSRLLERGARFEQLAGSHYKSYHGIAWKMGSFGTKDKYSVSGRMIVDTYGWNRFNPNEAIYLQPLSVKDAIDHAQEEEDADPDDGYDEDMDPDGMPIDGHFADEDNISTRRPLTTIQKLISSPMVRGYALTKKLWLNFFVNSVREIEWSEGAFENLVLPDNQKELILGFTETQRSYRGTFDDVIEGKGKGMVILLCGPPGVGKTLTAESVAEEMRVPLYMMSAGDLGLDPSKVESNLQNILEMCTKWNAILLLDEADVFLEQRSLHELERNKLVSIFLRTLEYYEGILFLTTNRVQTFDQAFQSRIHISLDYPNLSSDSRRKVWQNFVAGPGATGGTAAEGAKPYPHELSEAQLDSLALLDMNGRQIKNVLKTAQLLARRKDKPLMHEHIITVMDVMQHLHNNTRETERSRSALYG